MVWYNRGKELVLNPESVTAESPFTLSGDEIRIGLMVASYTLDIEDLLLSTSGVASFELSEKSVTNYAQFGDVRSLASKTFNLDTANDRAEFDAADLTYSTIGNGTNETFTQIIVMRVVDATETDTTTDLIAHSTVASTLTNGGDVTLQWNSEGILHITA